MDLLGGFILSIDLKNIDKTILGFIRECLGFRSSNFKDMIMKSWWYMLLYGIVKNRCDDPRDNSCTRRLWIGGVILLVYWNIVISWVISSLVYAVTGSYNCGIWGFGITFITAPKIFLIIVYYWTDKKDKAIIPFLKNAYRNISRVVFDD